MSSRFKVAGNRQKNRGSVLLFVLSGVVLMATLLAVLMNAAASESGRNITRSAAIARVSQFRSLGQVFAGALWEGLQANGALPDNSTAAAAMAPPAANLGDGVWSASITDVVIPAVNIGDRAATYGAGDGETMQVSSTVSRVRLTHATATGTISGRPNGTTDVTSSRTITATVAEIPATEFQFVVSDEPFVQTSSTNVLVRGRSLFNRGMVVRSPSNFRVSTSGAISPYSAFYGANNIVTSPIYATAPIGGFYGFTRAIGGMSNLFVAPTDSASGMIEQQGLRRAPVNYLRVVWNDAASDPAGISGIPGLSRQTILGASRLVLDLSAYYGYQNIDVDCGVATRTNGLVILGSPAGNDLNATPLSVTTNGALYLVGTNHRAVIAGTNHSLLIGANTAAPTTAPTADVTWTGYVCLAVGNPTISSTCGDWGAHSFEVQGTFAYPGGTLDNGSVPLVLTESPSTATALSSGDVRADRLFFLETR